MPKKYNKNANNFKSYYILILLNIKNMEWTKIVYDAKFENGPKSRYRVMILVTAQKIQFWVLCQNVKPTLPRINRELYVEMLAKTCHTRLANYKSN